MSIDSTDSREPPVFIAAGDVRRRLSECLRQPKAMKNFQRDPEDPSASVLKEPWEDKVAFILIFEKRDANTIALFKFLLPTAHVS